MRRAIVGELARKELVSWVRDRRALMANLIIPVLVMPLVLVGFPLFLINVIEGVEEEAQTLAVTGRDLPEQLRLVLEAAPFKLVIKADPAAAVRDGETDGGLLLAEGFADRLAAGETPEVVILGQFAGQKGQLVRAKASGALHAYAAGVTQAELVVRGVDPRVLNPIAIGFEDLSPRELAAAGILSFMIPILVITAAVSGGLSVGVDATAGEKERGTFEALLITPASRGEIVVGKGAATFVAAASTAFLTIGSVLASGAAIRAGLIPGLAEMEGPGGEAAEMLIMELALTTEAFLAMLFTAVLLTALLVTLVIAIAVQSKSYKEATTALSPLLAIVFLPLVLIQFAGFLEITPGFYAIPILNAGLLLDGLVTGAATPLEMGITWASTLIYAAAAVYFATWMFSREQVLFKN